MINGKKYEICMNLIASMQKLEIDLKKPRTSSIHQYLIKLTAVYPIKLTAVCPIILTAVLLTKP